MIRSIPLIRTDVHEADALMAIDDERRWPGNIEGGEAETMIDPILLDDRSIGIDHNGKRQILGLSVRLDLLGALANDHEHLRSQAAVCLEMGLQLLQLLAAIRSPGAADEHQDQRR
jgi:hypothetical protein